ncbi:MAG: DMT family transporter [Alphaproteobacteria bacterium]
MSSTAATLAPTRDPHYARGVVLMLSAGSIASLNGLLIRLVESSTDWQIIFWRNGFMFLFLFGVVAVRKRSQVFAAFRAAGRPGLAAGIALGFGNVSFALSIIHTTVANSLFILSASPFVAAIAAWLFLHERVARATLMAMVVALAGVGIMVVEGLGAGRFFGNLMAVCTMLGHAGFVVSLRWGRRADMLPSAVIAGLVGALIAAALSGGDLAVDQHDLAMCALMGMGAMSLGFICFTYGSRYVPAAQTALLSLSEVVLSPIWVLIFMDEVPTTLTFIGGALVFSAIIGQALWGMRHAAR